jgi:TfoX/Sxy family transcriptional regulator of competence genes
MAYDEGLAQRVRELFQDTPGVQEKRMFGGLAFMVQGNMAVGVSGKNALLCRLGSDLFAAALEKPHVKPMVHGGRIMKGFLYVDPAGVAEDEDLLYWVDLCRDYVQSLPPK